MGFVSIGRIASTAVDTKYPENRDFSFAGGKSGKARRMCSDKVSSIACDGSPQNTRFKWKLLSELAQIKKGDNGIVEETSEVTEEIVDDNDSMTSSDTTMESGLPMGMSQPIIIAFSVIAGLSLLRLIMPKASA